jgi:hypothetical protein
MTLFTIETSIRDSRIAHDIARDFTDGFLSEFSTSETLAFDNADTALEFHRIMGGQGLDSELSDELLNQ